MIDFDPVSTSQPIAFFARGSAPVQPLPRIHLNAFMSTRRSPLGDSDETRLILQCLVQEWDTVLKKPEDLRVSLTLPNLVKALHDELYHWIARHSPAGRAPDFSIKRSVLHARLAAILRDWLIASRDELSIVERFHWRELESLRRILDNSIIDGASLQAELEKILVTFESPFHRIAEFLADEIPKLARNLAQTGGFESDGIDESAALLARAALVYERADTLQKWLPQVLSLGATNAVLAHSEVGLRSDQTLHRQLNDATQVIASGLRRLEFSLEPIASEDLRYADLWGAAKVIVASDAQQYHAVRAFGIDALSSVTSRVLHHALIQVFNQKDEIVRNCWASLKSLADIVADWLETQELISSREGYPAFGGIVYDASRRFLAEAIGDAAAEAALDSDPDALPALQNWIDQFRRAQSREKSEIMWRLSERRAQAALVEWRKGLVTLAKMELQTKLENLAAGRLTVWGSTDQWSVWIRHLRGAARDSDSAWTFADWDRFDENDLRTALEPLSVAFSTSHLYDIIMPIEGAEVSGNAWRAGTLTWYTPASHSFGESRFGSPPHPKELRVMVTMQGATPVAARRKAKAVLEPALSALSFALSATERTGGFRPEFGRWFAFAETETGAWGSHGRIERTEFADKEVRSEQLEKFSRTYAPFIDRVASDGAVTGLEARLLRALFWYRSGRWQPNPGKRLLDHFIALEQLFAAHSPHKYETVAVHAGAIYSCWVFRGFPFSATINPVLATARKLFNDAKSDLSIAVAATEAALHFPNRRIDSWKDQLGPWLSPSFIAALEEHLPHESERGIWRTHADALRRFGEEEPNWQLFDEQRRDDVWFKIRMLAQRRHEIVHEGMTQSLEIEFEADVQTQITENVLMHFVEATLNNPYLVQVSDVMESLVPPWIE